MRRGRDRGEETEGKRQRSESEGKKEAETAGRNIGGETHWRQMERDRREQTEENR